MKVLFLISALVAVVISKPTNQSPALQGNSSLVNDAEQALSNLNTSIPANLSSPDALNDANGTLSAIPKNSPLIDAAVKALSNLNVTQVAAELPVILTEIEKFLPSQLSSLIKLIPMDKLPGIIANLTQKDIDELKTAVQAFQSGSTGAALVALEKFAISTHILSDPNNSTMNSTYSSMASGSQKGVIFGLTYFITIAFATVGYVIVF